MSKKIFVDDLSKYIDCPEKLIYHITKIQVYKIIEHPFPTSFDRFRFTVILIDGRCRSYGKTGDGNFYLDNKQRKKVSGWRKSVLHDDGSMHDPAYQKTKEIFLKTWKDHKLVGEWQYREEFCDDKDC